MILHLNGFSFDLSLLALRHGQWIALPLSRTAAGLHGEFEALRAELVLGAPDEGRIPFSLRFASPFPTRLRLRLSLPGQAELFHLIPGNIHGDNNAGHVRPGEFPVLASDRLHERNRAPLWEFRADRASHPVSLLCTAAGAVGLSIDPYSASDEAEEGFLRNGVFAALPDACGVSLGYGNDPLTFVEKTSFLPATADLARSASARGTLYAVRGPGRRAAHAVLRHLHAQLRSVAAFSRSYPDALRALAESFASVNWSPEVQQYTNRRCSVPTDTTLKPWRAIVEIGWTGGSMLAYPFVLAENIFPDLRLPRSGGEILDQICTGFNEASGLLNDTTLNRFTRNRPEGWNASEINGWWSGFLPQTRDNHCAYTNAHAAFYLLRACWLDRQAGRAVRPAWQKTALRVLDTAVRLQREDGAFGYIFSSREERVVDFDGFAGCWFAAALPLAWQITGEERYRAAADRALEFYGSFVRDLACWGSPMDTCKSIDSEGNLAFLRAARLLHQFTGEERYLEHLVDSAHYEYLWRYAFRTHPQCAPLRNSPWNSCGGTITSVSNPHIHPMGVVATGDLEYLARASGDDYHQARADDGMAWLMNTLELYPSVTGYGRNGVLSERTCPSDGLLAEKYHDSGAPASTWWSYNAWAAGSAMEAIAEQILAGRAAPSQGAGGRSGEYPALVEQQR